ncbi:HTH domain-containing protein [Allobaculum sp. Allo2]|uniref:HTH domain-containing protein n=1 Tax=Allobaculum sp. Allo2 TaxID=2853432 RepID=UPI001F6147D6|nr:HTH domain-containing protein [Allobaculum sp. Allo2]UNT92174.1 hypothetical protein KWG61_08000 [Allobaculum sp. Allo2]
MTSRRFTDEEIRLLEANPNTQFVSDSMIRFTQEFKDELWQALQNGSSPKAFFRNKGYDPKILGDSRIYNAADRLARKKAKQTVSPDQSKDVESLSAEIRSLKAELNALKKLSYWPIPGSRGTCHECTQQ